MCGASGRSGKYGSWWVEFRSHPAVAKSNAANDGMQGTKAFYAT